MMVRPSRLKRKSEDYLRDSQALEGYRHKPIAPEQLQAEMERMAGNTQQPEVLRELFEALGNDPFVIAECLATERLLTRTIRWSRDVLGSNRQSPGFALLPTQAGRIELSITNAECTVA